MTKKIWISFGLIFLNFVAFSQEKSDSTSIQIEPTEKWVPNPKKATFLALLPGGGQIYNRKWAIIKVPIIYGGFIGVGLGARFNQRTYVLYRDAHLLSANNLPHQFGNASTADLRRARDRFDKFRQQTYITLGIIYLAQIIEAYVAAHLLDFDIDDDLSLKMTTTVQKEYSRNLGFGAVMSF